MLNVGSERIAGLLPNSLIRTRGSGSARRIFLTFDDGPHPTVTDELCKVLCKYNVAASFFCIGENLVRYPDVARRLLEAGHSVCNHSHSHKNLRRLNAQEQIAELADCEAVIRELGGKDGRIVRAPQGQLSATAMLRLRRQNWDIVHWSYDSLDYQHPKPEALTERFSQRPVRNGDIILFHDDNLLSTRVLERLIPRWIDEGYSFGHVSDLA